MCKSLTWEGQHKWLDQSFIKVFGRRVRGSPPYCLVVNGGASQAEQVGQLGKLLSLAVLLFEDDRPDEAVQIVRSVSDMLTDWSSSGLSYDLMGQLRGTLLMSFGSALRRIQRQTN